MPRGGPPGMLVSGPVSLPQGALLGASVVPAWEKLPQIRRLCPAEGRSVDELKFNDSSTAGLVDIQFCNS